MNVVFGNPVLANGVIFADPTEIVQLSAGGAKSRTVAVPRVRLFDEDDEIVAVMAAFVQIGGSHARY